MSEQRPIDANALKENFLKWLPKNNEDFMNGDLHPIENIAVSAIMEIEEAPTIDTVKRGKWIDQKTEYVPPQFYEQPYRFWKTCSNCKTRLVETMLNADKYCPNCGSRNKE